VPPVRTGPHHGADLRARVAGAGRTRLIRHPGALGIWEADPKQCPDRRQNQRNRPHPLLGSRGSAPTVNCRLFFARLDA
jgi:hypothetical protein